MWWLQENGSGGGAEGDLRRGLLRVAPNGNGQEEDEEEENFCQTQEGCIDVSNQLLINVRFLYNSVFFIIF